MKKRGRREEEGLGEHHGGKDSLGTIGFIAVVVFELQHSIAYVRLYPPGPGLEPGRELPTQQSDVVSTLSALHSNSKSRRSATGHSARSRCTSLPP